MPGQPRTNKLLKLMAEPRPLPHGGLMAASPRGAAMTPAPEVLRFAQRMVGALPTKSVVIARARVRSLAVLLERLRVADSKRSSAKAARDSSRDHAEG